MPCTLDRSGHIATITFGSPAHNALSAELLYQITQYILVLKDDPFIKAILLSSEGERTFCAGADLAELKNIQDEVHGAAFFYGFAQLILAMRQSPHLILSRVQGKAIGGAVGIIAASDYVIASEMSQIRLSELIIGIGPFVVGPAIERKMGIAAFNQMTLSPKEWYDARFALTHGLFNKVTKDINSLDHLIDEKLTEWSGYSTIALQEIKKMLWSSTPSWDVLFSERAAMSGRLIMTAESKAALSALKS